MSEILYIPIEAEALVVNNKERNPTFQRSQLAYNNVENFLDIDTNSQGLTTLEKKDNGVYIQWKLPQALKEGVQDNETGETTFPLIPNRWLIVRNWGKEGEKKVRSWVVESDFMDKNDGTSNFLNPFSNSFERTKIGRKSDANSWEEPNPDKLFLTVIGSGEITFSTFQPYNENVLSIHDDLSDAGSKANLSYLITGWYSDPKKDIVNTKESIDDILEGFNWYLADTDDKRAVGSSLCHGAIFNINWDKDGTAYPSDKPETPEAIRFAIGNNSVDALMALIRDTASDSDMTLLEAFQNDLLDSLNQPNGQKVLEQETHKGWFGKTPGGIKYIVKKKEEKEYKDVTNSYDPNWLYELNSDQKKYEEKVQKLKDLQWNIYRIWFCKQKYDSLDKDIIVPGTGVKTILPKTYDQDFKNNLNPKSEKSESVARKIVELQAEIKKAQEHIPFGENEEKYITSIKNYAEEYQIENGYQLRAIRTDDYTLANEPVILFSGLKSEKYEEKAIKCRYQDQLINGDDKSNSMSDLSIFDRLPQGISPLYKEFLLLTVNHFEQRTDTLSDTNNIEGSLPDINLNDWQQPWSPLFLKWKIKYYPIGFEDNWTFDGERYSWRGDGSSADNSISFSGKTFLTPNSSYNFKIRLTEFKKKVSDLSINENKEIEQLIEKVENWDFLSQKMEGLNHLISCKNIGTARYPTSGEVSDLIGDMNYITPVLGEIKRGDSKSNFLDIRSGQFYFTDLSIIDAFGRSLDVINEHNVTHHMPVVAKNLKPEKFVFPESKERLIQLPPRLLQSARLNFDFVSDVDDSKLINFSANTNPICGWILPDHLDKSLNCYSNNGESLGKAKIVVDKQNNQALIWEKTPESKYDNFNEIHGAFHHLGKFLLQLSKQPIDVYKGFFITIDETLWSIDPLGDRNNQNLSVLLGRPLALTRARVNYELEEEPIQDQTWKKIFESKDPEFLNYTFPIQLGGQELRKDGLIGYFKDDDYDQFNAVHSPAGIEKGTYIKHVNKNNLLNMSVGDNRERFITMLIDPRAKVHATTSILPVTTIELPSRYIEEAFNNMEAFFKVNTYFSTLLVEDDSNENESEIEKELVIPIPAEQSRVWSFMTLEEKKWKKHQLISSSKNQTNRDVNPKIRSGYLKLNNKKNV